MNKRICLVSEFYYPVDTATGYYMTEIAEFLAKKGDIEVHVICTNAKYNAGISYDFSKEEIRNDVHIHRVITGTIDKNNFFKRAVRLLYSSLCLFFKVLKTVKRHDTLLAVTNPAFMILLLPFVKFLKRTKYVLLVHDIFPENMVAVGKMHENSFLYRILKKIFDWAYSRADVCISIGRDMTKVVEEKTRNRIPVETITNWADTTNVYPIEKRKCQYRKDLGLETVFVFEFAGNLGRVQGLDNILAAISLINDVRLHFLFIGDGAKRVDIENFANSNPLKNVTCIGFQERKRQNDFLNACDVGIVTLADGMYGIGVPSKSYNIMASGKPILMISDPGSEIALCVKEFGIGWVVEPNNPEKLKEAFLAISRCTDLENMGRKARFVAESEFAKEFILMKYCNLLK